MKTASDATRPLSLKRHVLFRAGALSIGLLAVLLLEVVLRLFGLGRIEDAEDPFVGFSKIRPLFVLNEAGDRYEMSKSRLTFFQPDSFAAQKGPNEYRIFCLGGSTVQGRPYSIETSFTTWLELSLKAADVSKQWQVVNCGGVSYASYRLVPVMEEILRYKPDMFIVYTGHNEFLEERTYANIRHQPAWVRNVHARLVDSRIYGSVRQLVKPSREAKKTVDLPAEVDALLDYQGGLEKYHRNDDWRAGVILHYENNLRRMVQIARQANVPIVFANPVSNVRDTPPFKAEISSRLSSAERAEFERLWDTAKSSDWNDLEGKEQLVRQVLDLDGRHAEARFLMAKVNEAMGRIDAAKREYLLAKDEDICPLRMLEPMHDILAEVSRQTRTPLLDVRGCFEAKAELGIPGDGQLIDHVHPRIEGHQLIAMEFFDFLVRKRILNPRDGWQARQKQLYSSNFESLPASYFPESLERLRGLQRWAAGRVTRLKMAAPSSN